MVDILTYYYPSSSLPPHLIPSDKRSNKRQGKRENKCVREKEEKER